MPGLGAALAPLGEGGGSGGGGADPRLKELNQTVGLTDALRVSYGATSAVGIGVAPAMTPTIRPGRIISEVVRMQSTLTPNFKYTWTVAEQVFMASALKAAPNITLSDGVGVHAALTTSLAVTVLQRLGIAAAPLPSLTYTQTLVQGIGLSGNLRNFFGAGLVDGIGVTSMLGQRLRASPILTDGIGVTPALTSKFYIRVTLADTIGFNDSTILNAIYNGQLADGIEVVAGYVAPNGSFTTWAMNTRSGAVTEYQNYEFNSFACIRDVYYGASSTGLYELVGDDDAGADIIAKIKSGFAQWSGTHLGSVKAAYLAVRGGGDFVLKIESGDGKTYTYAVSAKDMATTKISIGKGLRARYFAFELISTGQDFDLDTLEFVPLVAERRV